MTYFYSAEENTFYHSDIHSEIPINATKITDKSYQKILDGKAQGLAVMPDNNGKPVLTEPKPTEYHEWNGRKWTLDKVGEQAVISERRIAKLAEINNKSQAFVSELAELEKVPSFERETWQEQRNEAMRWKADNQAQTPTLELIAKIRGVPLDLLRERAYAKAVAYSQMAAIIAGQRQAYEDRLEQAQTLAEIEAINPVYQLPNGDDDE